LLKSKIDVSVSLANKPIVIRDCYAITEYISSEGLRNYFSRIDTSPIIYNYEQCEITLKNLPLNETVMRLDNIKGGNTPTCLFAGIIPTSALNGSFTLSSNQFTNCDVETINITLNGNAVNGYPIDIANGSPILMLQKFYDVTNRLMNPLASDGLGCAKFKYNWLYSHRFEGEISEQGWIGMNIKLSTPYTVPHTLVIWTIQNTAVSIDKFHQIERLQIN